MDFNLKKELVYEEKHWIGQQAYPVKTKLSPGRIIYESTGTGRAGQMRPVLPVKENYLNRSFLQHTGESSMNYN